MERQGAIILDAQRNILVMTPVAEDILGWRNDQVAGLSCGVVFGCQDAAGQPCCGQCGFDAALSRKEITPPAPVQMADSFGGRRAVQLSFWYLPPAGAIAYPRLLAVVEAPGVAAAVEEAS